VCAACLEYSVCIFGEGNVESAEECYQHFVKCIHQATKEALKEKILRNNT
jgi:hypothetical protein